MMSRLLTVALPEVQQLPTVFILLLWATASTVHAQDPACPVGNFGVNCSQECHCLNGVSVCKALLLEPDGNLTVICEDYQCDLGWTDPPVCQHVCRASRFGKNCELECHCPEGVRCDRVNGVCVPDPTCHPEWTGASCQKRRPKLVNAPSAYNVSCGRMSITWRQWSPDTDIGDSPVGNYTLEYRRNQGQWLYWDRVNFNPAVTSYQMAVNFNLDPNSYYQFRVIANRVANDKLDPGLPSPESTPARPACAQGETTPEPISTLRPPDGTSTPQGSTTTASPVIPSIPSSPNNVTVSQDNFGRVFVHWKPPDVLGGPLVGYRVTVQQIGIGDCDDTTLGAPMMMAADPSAASFELLNLARYTKYRVTVNAINRLGIGPPIARIFISPETAPTGTVRNLGHTNISATSVVFTWDPVPCPQRGGALLRYDVLVREVNSESAVIGSVTTNTTFSVSNLKPFTTYAIAVRYTNRAGEGPYSSEYQIRTAQIRPEEVRNITVSVDQSGRVYVHWNMPSEESGPLTGYNITYQKIGIGDCQELTGPPGPVRSSVVDSLTTSVALEQLELWSKYRITVRAINTAGPGTITETVFITPQIEPSGTVKNFNHTRLTSNSVTFTWDKVPCPQRGGEPGFYDVTVRNVAEDVTVKTARITTLAYDIGGLTPFTSYGIKVRYGNRVAIGPESTEYIIKTSLAVPPTPQNVRLLGFNQTAFRVGWDTPSPSHGEILEYRVSYSEPETPDTERTVTVPARPGAEQSLTVTGLEPATRVNVRVEAKTSAGWGEVSDPPLVVTTEDGMPSVPTDLQYTSRNETCISLRWFRPQNLNGELVGYRISYRPLSINSVSNSDPSPINKEVPASVTTYDACRLLPASEYLISVAAASRSGYGPEAQITVYTFIGVVESPPKPEIVTQYRTTVIVNLQPAAITGGPVTAYFIVVGKVNGARQRKRRNLPDPTTVLNLPGYTAARLEPFQIRAGSVQFVIGDNRTYGGYRNVPLIPGTAYNIQYIVGSEVGDAPPKMTNASADRIAVTAPAVEEFRSNTARLLSIILPIILGLLLLLLLALLLWWFCCRNRNIHDKQDEKLNTTNIWDIYNTYYNTKDKKNLWSDIQDLNDPRHVTIYEDKSYDPDDLRVSTIQEGQPKISFKEEYDNLPVGITQSTNAAKRQENAEKNRIDHILPYDHSRVKLRRRNNDYINANYVNGYMQDQAYIAASSPFTDKTVDDFWFMIYQEKVTVIVFLNRVQEDTVLKSVEYWPEDGNTANFHSISVQHEQTDSYANFMVRTFTVYKAKHGQVHKGQDSSRKVTQFQFISWPDHGVPNDPIPFLDFHMKVKTSISGPGGIMDHSHGPVLVHCGTGVSRTAVYIAVDALLEQAKLENAVNVYRFVHKMRQNRPHMVRTLKQYRFIYDTLFEALITNYNVVGDDLKVNYRLLSRTNPVTDKSYFREQFEVLEEFIEPLTAHQTFTALQKQNRDKNRFETILPPDEYRVVLQTPGGLGRTDYINALYIDGYVKQREFIVTQTPLRSTVIDFWKMIWDCDVRAIVMLNGSDFREDSCAQYWPPRVGSEKFDPFIVHLKSTTENDYVTIRTMTLSSGLRPNEPARRIQQFQFEAWHMYEKVPWSREGFIQLIEQVELYREKTQSLHTPVVVHCCDGANQSGLFCACAVLFEKLSLEGEVDIFHTIKHMKRRRTHFINSLEQYKYCFKLLWDYLNVRIKGFSVDGQVNSAYDNSDSVV